MTYDMILYAIIIFNVTIAIIALIRGSSSSCGDLHNRLNDRLTECELQLNTKSAKEQSQYSYVKHYNPNGTLRDEVLKLKAIVAELTDEVYRE